MHKKVLVMTLIIGMSMQMMKVVISAVEIEEEEEQQEMIVQSEVRIPVQGYIIPIEHEIKEPVIPEHPKEIEEQEVAKLPEEKEIIVIPDTRDVGKYHKYVLMSIISVLWIFVLWSYNEKEQIEEDIIFKEL